eukprot:TRINITY_DN70599_c0_g1_i1.p1 TRINITY_DN70599_c0_g1~~TRINITY_DN70599_c0_g1_i1.p1  ORF type:complete len:900 (-),score=221.13 TRINITY_DN70599_c0_g1_i1:120-2819(-)
MTFSACCERPALPLSSLDLRQVGRGYSALVSPGAYSIAGTGDSVDTPEEKLKIDPVDDPHVKDVEQSPQHAGKARSFEALRSCTDLIAEVLRKELPSLIREACRSEALKEAIAQDLKDEVADALRSQEEVSKQLAQVSLQLSTLFGVDLQAAGDNEKSVVVHADMDNPHQSRVLEALRQHNANAALSPVKGLVVEGSPCFAWHEEAHQSIMALPLETEEILPYKLPRSPMMVSAAVSPMPFFPEERSPKRALTPVAAATAACSPSGDSGFAVAIENIDAKLTKITKQVKKQQTKGPDLSDELRTVLKDMFGEQLLEQAKLQEATAEAVQELIRRELRLEQEIKRQHSPEPEETDSSLTGWNDAEEHGVLSYVEQHIEREVAVHRYESMLHNEFFETKQQKISKAMADRSADKNRIEIFARTALGVDLHHYMRRPNNCLVKLIDSELFGLASATAIIANGCFIGYNAEQSVQSAIAVSLGKDVEDPQWPEYVNMSFTGFFILELLTRMAALRCAFFVGDDWNWNVFDFVLVLGAFGADMSGWAMAPVLQALRFARVLRAIRIVKFLTSLRQMICAMLHSLPALGWAAVMMILFMYFFSILFMQTSAHYILKGENEETRSALARHWGGFWRSVLTLFMTVTGGCDWVEAIEPLFEISPVWALVFAIYIFVTMFGVFSILIGVFVEKAFDASSLDRDLVITAENRRVHDFMCEMSDIFSEIFMKGTRHHRPTGDTSDGIHDIDLEIFKESLKDERMVAYLHMHKLDLIEPERFFRLLDVDGSGCITISELILGMMRLGGQAKSVDVMLLLAEVGKLLKAQKAAELDRAAEVAATSKGFGQTDSQTSGSLSPAARLERSRETVHNRILAAKALSRDATREITGQVPAGPPMRRKASIEICSAD